MTLNITPEGPSVGTENINYSLHFTLIRRLLWRGGRGFLPNAVGISLWLLDTDIYCRIMAGSWPPWLSPRLPGWISESHSGLRPGGTGMLHLGAPFQPEQPVLIVIYVFHTHSCPLGKKLLLHAIQFCQNHILENTSMVVDACVGLEPNEDHMASIVLFLFFSFLFFLLFESSQCLVLCKSVSNKPFRCVRLQWGDGVV